MFNGIQLWQAGWNRRTAQRAIQIIAPAMKRAGDHVRAFAPIPGQNACTTMTTQVMKGPNLTLFVAHHQGALSAHIEGDIVTRIRNIRYVTGNLPMAPEQGVLFHLCQLITAISPGRQATAVPFFRGSHSFSGRFNDGIHNGSPYFHLYFSEHSFKLTQIAEFVTQNLDTRFI